MKLIVGLGNPGHEYELTRHNAGFQVVDSLSIVCGGEWKLAKNLQAAIIKGRLANQEVLLAKPFTYMNESGRAVIAILNWFKMPVSDLYVVHDDVSINLGRLRLQAGAGAGGQHGVESIIENLGGKKDFTRIKFGVGPDPGGDVRGAYVLNRVPEKDRACYQKCIETARNAVIDLLVQGLVKASNSYNGVSICPESGGTAK